MELCPNLTPDIVTGPGRVRDAEMRFQKREGTGTYGAANVETQFLQPKADSCFAGSKLLGPSAPVERQKKKKSLNAIDDLFQGLD